MSEIKVENFKNYLELFFPQSEKLLRQDVWGVFLSACWRMLSAGVGQNISEPQGLYQERQQNCCYSNILTSQYLFENNLHIYETKKHIYLEFRLSYLASLSLSLKYTYLSIAVHHILRVAKTATSWLGNLAL